MKEKLHLSESDLREQVGPGFYERWYKWTSLTEEQSKKAAILGKSLKTTYFLFWFYSQNIKQMALRYRLLKTLREEFKFSLVRISKTSCKVFVMNTFVITVILGNRTYFNFLGCINKKRLYHLFNLVDSNNI